MLYRSENSENARKGVKDARKSKKGIYIAHGVETLKFVISYQNKGGL